MVKKSVEAPKSSGDSPAGDASPLAPPAGSFLRLGMAAVEPGPAEVLAMLHDVREAVGRTFDDMLDAAYWVDRVNQGSPYEAGVLRRCKEHAMDLLSLWARRCEQAAREAAK